MQKNQSLSKSVRQNIRIRNNKKSKWGFDAISTATTFVLIYKISYRAYE